MSARKLLAWLIVIPRASSFWEFSASLALPDFLVSWRLKLYMAQFPFLTTRSEDTRDSKHNLIYRFAIQNGFLSTNIKTMHNLLERNATQRWSPLDNARLLRRRVPHKVHRSTEKWWDIKMPGMSCGIQSFCESPFDAPTHIRGLWKPCWL